MNRFESSFESSGEENEIRDLFDADQRDRTSGLHESDRELFLNNERGREERARQILSKYENGEISLSPEARAKLGGIFHHRGSTEDYRTAFKLLKSAVEDGFSDARWWCAAAEDRMLISEGKSQRWGTQFKKTDGKWDYMAPVEDDSLSGITDEARAEMGVPAREDQLRAIAEKYKDR